MLQFRLRTLFFTTTTAAVLAWAFYAPPQWLGLMAIYLVYALLPAATIAGTVFHRGYWQAFFIGMAPCIVVYSFWIGVVQLQWSPPYWALPSMSDILSEDADQIIYMKLLLTIPLAIAATSGLVAVGIRWWALLIEKRAGK